MRKTMFLLAFLVTVHALASNAAGTAIECSGTCSVEATIIGYVPPVIVVANDTEVVWGSLDVVHRQTETPVQPHPTCFSVASSASADSPPVRFHIENGTLNATAWDSTTMTVVTRSCHNAVSLPGGGFVVPYHCTLHPNMRGTIVIDPT